MNARYGKWLRRVRPGLLLLPLSGACTDPTVDIAELGATRQSVAADKPPREPHWRDSLTCPGPPQSAEREAALLKAKPKPILPSKPAAGYSAFTALKAWKPSRAPTPAEVAANAKYVALASEVQRSALSDDAKAIKLAAAKREIVGP